MMETVINIIKMGIIYISYISAYEVYLVLSHCSHFYDINVR